MCDTYSCAERMRRILSEENRKQTLLKAQSRVKEQKEEEVSESMISVEIVSSPVEIALSTPVRIRDTYCGGMGGNSSDGLTPPCASSWGKTKFFAPPPPPHPPPDPSSFGHGEGKENTVSDLFVRTANAKGSWPAMQRKLLELAGTSGCTI